MRKILLAALLWSALAVPQTVIELPPGSTLKLPTGGLLTVPGQFGYNFKYFINVTGLCNNANTGLSVAQAWCLDALNTKQTTYAGNAVCVIAGTYNIFTIVGVPPPGFNNPMLRLAAGSSPTSPTVMASCNSSGVYSPVGPSAVSWATLNAGMSEPALSVATAGTTTTVLQDSAASYTVNQFSGGTWWLIDMNGAETGGIVRGSSVIASNTATSITVSVAITGMTVNDAYIITNNPQFGPALGEILGVTANAGSYVTIDGFEMFGCTDRCISMGSATTRVQGINVINLYMHDSYTYLGNGGNPTGITYYNVGGTGIGLTPSAIRNNYITSFLVKDGSNRGTGIETWNTQGITVSYNTLLATTQTAPVNDMGAGIYFKNSGNGNSTVNNNYIDLSANANAQNGFASDNDNSGPNSPNVQTFHHNIVVNRLAGGGNGVFYAVAGVARPFSETEVYYNNTFVNSTTGMLRSLRTCLLTDYNNLYALTNFSGGYGDTGQINPDSEVLTDYNFFTIYQRNLCNSPSQPGCGGGGANTSYTSTGTYAAHLTCGTVTGLDSHSVINAGGPVFTNAGTLAQKYQLQATSPAHNAGSSTGAPGGTVVDIGAWSGQTQIGSTAH